MDWQWDMGTDTDILSLFVADAVLAFVLLVLAAYRLSYHVYHHQLTTLLSN